MKNYLNKLKSLIEHFYNNFSIISYNNILYRIYTNYLLIIFIFRENRVTFNISYYV